jgi:hypothetical protein
MALYGLSLLFFHAFSVARPEKRSTRTTFQTAHYPTASSLASYFASGALYPVAIDYVGGIVANIPRFNEFALR